MHRHSQACWLAVQIFTGYLGKGDKETFAYGMATMGEPYYVIPTPPASLGTKGEAVLLLALAGLLTTVRVFGYAWEAGKGGTYDGC